MSELSKIRLLLMADIDSHYIYLPLMGDQCGEWHLISSHFEVISSACCSGFFSLLNGTKSQKCVYTGRSTKLNYTYLDSSRCDLSVSCSCSYHRNPYFFFFFPKHVFRVSWFGLLIRQLSIQILICVKLTLVNFEFSELRSKLDQLGFRSYPSQHPRLIYSHFKPHSPMFSLTCYHTCE